MRRAAAARSCAVRHVRFAPTFAMSAAARPAITSRRSHESTYAGSAVTRSAMVPSETTNSLVRMPPLIVMRPLRVRPLRLRSEPVADAAYGLDALADGPELLAQALHVRVDGARRDVGR